MISVSSHLLPHNSGRQCLLPIENLHVQNLQVSNMTAHVWDFLEQEPVSSSTLHEHNHRKAITENQTLGKKEVQTHRTLPASGQLEISCHISPSPFKKCLKLHTKCRIWTTIPPSPFITTVTVCVRGKSIATVFWWKTHCYRTRTKTAGGSS